ncbi:MAG: hypothetical protein D6713_08285 [Deltaproteobacteria bacterium]|nr:MAG: hypothetical protein D6713_08285 [Deltaproteobacteria bacterium]
MRVYIILLAVALGLRVLTFNRYLHTACKVCGERQPWRVRFKKDDVCGLCSSRSHEFRGGARALEKAANIRLYRKATIARSLLLPGYTFLAMNSVTIYALWTGLFSFFLSLFVIFRFAFPGNLSSLYGKIHAYGLVISGVGCGAIYLFFNGLGAAVFRRLLKKHRVWGI